MVDDLKRAQDLVELVSFIDRMLEVLKAYPESQQRDSVIAKLVEVRADGDAFFSGSRRVEDAPMASRMS